MKKTSQIALTIVSSLSIQLGFAQTNSGEQTNVNAPDTATSKNEIRDTLAGTPPLQQSPPQYYFHWHFYDNCYHRCFPRHYYLLTHPHCTHEELSHVHYGPRRSVSGNQKVAKTKTATNGSSSPRGGFGHYGTTKSANS